MSSYSVLTQATSDIDSDEAVAVIVSSSWRLAAINYDDHLNAGFSQVHCVMKGQSKASPNSSRPLKQAEGPMTQWCLKEKHHEAVH